MPTWITFCVMPCPFVNLRRAGALAGAAAEHALHAKPPFDRQDAQRREQIIATAAAATIG